MFSMSAFARLDGAIFTTTPAGDIVNENVRYQSKEEVFLDGGPGPQAPRTAAALPEGLYYFQVTDPSGKCLLSSTLESADTNGGTCYEDVKIKGKNAKNAEAFYAEPLSCRLFYFDGEDGVTFINDSYTMTQEVKVRGKMETQSIVVECRHQLGSEYLEIDPSAMPDGETIQLFPFANTPNSGGVYKAWVSTAESVEAACESSPDWNEGIETGENCNGFFGFIPRNSKTDNFKALTETPIPPNFDIALRSFHDKNLNCQYDPLVDEIIPNWEFGLRDIDPNMLGMRNTKLSNDLPADPVRFSVFGVENHPWTIDQFMWWAHKYEGIAPMNNTPSDTPFSHFTTFSELKDFAPTFDDGALRVSFKNAIACPEDTESLSLLAVTDDIVKRSSGEDTDEEAGNQGDPDGDTGFVPGMYAEPTYDDDPVLTIRFGSIGVARLEVCKSFDADGSGSHDEGEQLIPNWPVTLYIPESVPVLPEDGNFGPGNPEFDLLAQLLIDTGYLKEGEELAEVKNRYVTKLTEDGEPNESGEYPEGYGCVKFNVLVPNVVPTEDGTLPSYKVSEDVDNLTPTWMNTSAYNITFDVESVLSELNGAPVVEGVVRNRSDGEEGNKVYFNNVCKITVDFDTKGYWHNKNGLAELTEADRDYVNGLDPYDSPTVYFGAGDEPFDGEYMDGTAVAAAFSDGSVIWGAGTWQSEVSHFLTDNNGNADLNEHKEQLAQQLLAFIFNTRHRPVDSGLSPATKLWFGGEWVSVEDIIDSAISAWQGSDIYTIDHIKTLLDGMNNNDAVEIPVSSPEECPAAYPPEES
ncbi:hypothetical protein M272_22985 [Vibrio natriegens NBRC 15636 = ATCC 14048 = DSM 759]|nr:hypothetical protein M272_22985 [Vibrio natriegens NBRC 15636 = ATCC 14048 = DSM 759]